MDFCHAWFYLECCIFVEDFEFCKFGDCLKEYTIWDYM